jgi:hypothetical protein
MMAKSKPKTPRPAKKVSKKPAAASPPTKPPKKPPAPPAAPNPPSGGYDKFRDQQAAISRERSKSGREAGPLPPVVDPIRKACCRENLRLFFETYFPERFPLAWCPDHLTCIAKMQTCILEGGQMAFAMPRSSGKTSLAEAGAIHALVYGHRRYVALVGASEDAAKEMLLSIKMEFETNELLFQDFPEVCHLIRQLEGINNRANGQTLNGERTRIAWTDTRAVLPTVPGSASSGGRLRVAGITGRIRGMKATVVTGESIRPDLAIVDDPQTDDSAVSPSQNNKREAILNGAILGLAGPRTRIACFVPTTIIAPGDLSDRILDRQRHPVWQGEKSRMVIDWPKNMEMWDKYADLRKNSQRHGGKGEEATVFYVANRAAMDAGTKVSWPQRFYSDEISGIQHAMNLRCDRGTARFQAEYQNDPEPDAIAGLMCDLETDVIVRKLNRAKRGMVPPDCTRLTAFVDVGGGVLYYVVCGWNEGFGGAVVDYGTCPKQNRAYFAAVDARPSLADVFKNHDDTARVYAGLKATVDAVVNRPYPRQGGGELRVGMCCVDTGWLPDTVYTFCRESSLAALLMPYRGYGIGASSNPMANWAPRPGEGRPGWFWRKTATTGSGRGTHILADVNHWKSFVTSRLLTPAGGVGCLSLFGDDPTSHQLFADHLTSEYRVRTSGHGREVDEWRVKVGKPDNHWWDCLVGNAVAASALGVQWSAAGALGESVPPRAARPKISLKQLREEIVAKKGKPKR